MHHDGSVVTAAAIVVVCEYSFFREYTYGLYLCEYYECYYASLSHILQITHPLTTRFLLHITSPLFLPLSLASSPFQNRQACVCIIKCFLKKTLCSYGVLGFSIHQCHLWSLLCVPLLLASFENANDGMFLSPGFREGIEMGKILACAFWEEKSKLLFSRTKIEKWLKNRYGLYNDVVLGIFRAAGKKNLALVTALSRLIWSLKMGSRYFRGCTVPSA